MEGLILSQVIEKMAIDEMAVVIDQSKDILNRSISKEGYIIFWDENDNYILKYKHNKQEVAICKGMGGRTKFIIKKRNF